MVVLCFEGPACLKECVVARNELFAEIVFRAPTFHTSVDAAKWLMGAVFDTTSSKMRRECKPVVVEKDNVLRIVQEHNAM